jgi:hypothetical protein
MTDLLTPNLDLPLIASAQAQKHITHNEAIWALDSMVHLSVPRSPEDTPPVTPVTGERHIVGQAPAGEWAGQAGKVAVRRDAAWLFLSPRPGWRAWSEADGALLVYDGSTWTLQASGNGGGGATERFPRLGVGTDADSTNVLSVAGAATLLSHAGSGHRVTVNKASQGETSSLLFQSNWSGRAEMGLAGQDDFSVKVSPDGSAWHDALVCDRATGAVTLPGGLAGTGSAAGSLGGQIMAVVGERKVVSAGNSFAYGNGSMTSAGPVMPFAGRVMAMSISVLSGGGGSASFAPSVNGLLQSAGAVSVSGSTAGPCSGVGDYRSAPIPFAAGTILNVGITQSNSMSEAVATLYVRFD